MNVLSLRVSTMRGTENLKKNSELRMERLRFSEDFLVRIVENKVATQFAFTIQEAVSVEQQVNDTRLFAKDKDIVAIDKITALTVVLLECPLKHAVRGAIIKILQTNYKGDPVYITILEDALHSYLQRNEKLSDWRNYFPVISCVIGLLENIVVTRESMARVCSSVYNYLIDSLRQVSDVFILKEVSPSVINEVLILMHTIIRALLNVCQEFGDGLKAKSTNFEATSSLMKDFLANDDVPMDTKSNCAHLQVILAKLNGTYVNIVSRKLSGELSIYDSIGIVVDISHGIQIETWKLLNVITAEVINVALEYSKQQNMVLACSRLMFRISKILPQLIGPETPEDHEILSTVIDHLFSFTFSHLENFMDSVRHMSRDSMKAILTFAKDRMYHDALEDVFRRLDQGCSKKIRFITYTCVATVYGSSRVMEVPGLVEELIESLGESNFDISAENCIEVLMRVSKSELSIDDWILTWIHPLMTFLDRLSLGDCNTKTVVESLVRKAVKNDTVVIRRLIRDNSLPISIRLTVTTMAKKYGALDKGSLSDDGLWKGLFPVENLRAAMVNFDDRVRIQSLTMIVETMKITEHYEQIDLELLRFFYKYNVNAQSPATRDQIQCLFRQCFSKLKVVIPHCKKKREQDKVDMYVQFLMGVSQDSIENLRFNGNFSRRNTSLVILEQLQELFEESNICDSLKEDDIDALVNAFSDSYECNKVLAMNIIRGQNENNLFLGKYSDLEKLRIMITSTNPGDSTTASYHLEMITLLGKKVSPQIYIRKLYVTVKWLIEIVNAGIEQAMKSLVSAAKNNPIYGPMLCIRHLLAGLDVHLVCGDMQWKKLIAQLIQMCFEASDAVKMIVNSSSPEGHLPNDFGTIAEKENPDDVVTPQMILLMGWRTIKEVCLLLGDLTRYPVVTKLSPNGLLALSQIMEIGDLFRELLAETKHRGAFEQAFVGFSKLCCRLWTAQDDEMHSLPMKWLEELMEIVKGENTELNSKICATRRSAGVPFMVQALITSEIQVCSSRALQYSMETLFELCEIHNGNTEFRTHALNILRALFRCTDLNGSVVEYVDRGLIVAIKSSAAETWPERNSATLLFSALVIRIFGVQRTKEFENLGTRNKMTGRIFFLRYPRLYDFFLTELNEASVLLAKRGRALKLFPILLVLGRLYPSALEGTESSLSLHSFVTEIEKCCSCPEIKTRVLIGKSIASLLVPNLSWDYMRNIIGTWATTRDFNAKHSILLIIQRVLDSEGINWNLTEVNGLAEMLLNQVEITRIARCWTLTKTLLEIFVTLCSKDGNRSHPWMSRVEDMLICLEKVIMSRETSDVETGIDTVASAFVILKLKCLKDQNLICTELVRLAQVAFFQETSVSLMLLFLLRDQEKNLSDFELKDIEVQFVNRTQNTHRESIRTRLENEPFIVTISSKIIESESTSYDLRNKAMAVASYFFEKTDSDVSSNDNLLFQQVLEAILNRESSYEAKGSMYQLYHRNSAKMGFAMPMKIIKSFSTIENTLKMRLTSTRILNELAVERNMFNDAQQTKQYAYVVLLLLRDEDAEVRESMSKNLPFYSACESTFLEVYAQENFLHWIATESIAIWGENETISILKELSKDIEEEQQKQAIQAFGCTDSTADDDQSRVFDRNEANQFEEIGVVLAQIQKLIQGLEMR